MGLCWGKRKQAQERNAKGIDADGLPVLTKKEQEKLGKMFQVFCKAMPNEASPLAEIRALQNQKEFIGNPFIEKVFSLFDQDNDGKVNLSEFITVMRHLKDSDEAMDVKYKRKWKESDPRPPV